MKTTAMSVLAAALLAAPWMAGATEFYVQSVDSSTSCNPQSMTSADPASISGSCMLVGGAVPTNFGTIASAARATSGAVGARSTAVSTDAFAPVAGGASARATGAPINFSYNGPGLAPGDTFMTSINLDLKGNLGITGQGVNFSSAEIIFDVGTLGRYSYLLRGNDVPVIGNSFAATSGTITGDISNLAFDLTLTSLPFEASLLLPLDLTVGIMVITTGGAFIPSGAFADFYNSGTFAVGRPVFNLPDGYTANAGDYLANNRYGAVVDPVPEPGTLALLGLGLAGLGLSRRRRAN